ncbi:MAG TPA: hypothetical protein VJI13_00290 [Candidatus Norongarragalinales archaeon]|nr:hypothetical protein [Candidatus Norongarragalinales archaeon]
MAKRGFIFSLEAALALLLAISIIAGMHYMRLPTFSGVYLQELNNDFQEMAAKKYYAEFAAYSKGDLLAGEKIKSEFGRLIGRLGDYCLIIDARANNLKINCIQINELKFRKITPSSRLFYDGEGFFELKMRLIA